MKYKVIGFSGSIRKESFNTKLIKAFQDMAPKNVEFGLIDISNLPFINEDLEEELPAPGRDLHKTIEQCDAVVFATPEYNRSYSPILKNAIDWGSRLEGKNKWKRKPVAVVGCTPYSLGAFGAQNHLRQVIMYVDMLPLQQPEFYLADAADKFDKNGKLKDKETKEKISEVWQALIELVKISKK